MREAGQPADRGIGLLAWLDLADPVIAAEQRPLARELQSPLR
jgi:hypothetical protein